MWKKILEVKSQALLLRFLNDALSHIKNLIMTQIVDHRIIYKKFYEYFFPKTNCLL